MTRSLIFSSFVFPPLVCSEAVGEGVGEGVGVLVDEQAVAAITVHASKAGKRIRVFGFNILTSCFL